MTPEERNQLVKKVKGFTTHPFNAESLNDKELEAWSSFIDFMKRDNS